MGSIIRYFTGPSGKVTMSSSKSYCPFFEIREGEKHIFIHKIHIPEIIKQLQETDEWADFPRERWSDGEGLT